MKILSISLDKKILNKESANFQRQKEYARLVDEVHVVVFSKDSLKIKAFPLFVYGGGGKSKVRQFYKAYQGAKKVLKNENKSKWLITTQDPFFCGLLGYLLKKKLGVKLHIQVHGDFFGSKYFRKEFFQNHFLYFLGKFIIKRADGCRVVSNRIKNSILSFGIDKNTITVIPMYVENSNKFRPENSKQSKEKFILLTIDRLVKVKNIDLQIRVLAEAIKKQSALELWIVGDGPERKRLNNLAKRLGIKDRVRFWGWRDNLENFYNQADIFLLTSIYEGWPRVIIEAAGFALPIIMTNTGSAGEFIKNNENGLIVPINNQGALKEAIFKLLNNKDLCQRLSLAVQRSVVALPSKEQILNLYKNSWEKALGIYEIANFNSKS